MEREAKALLDLSSELLDRILDYLIICGDGTSPELAVAAKIRVTWPGQERCP
jgi:hypothetical protein